VRLYKQTHVKLELQSSPWNFLNWN